MGIKIIENIRFFYIPSLLAFLSIYCDRTITVDWSVMRSHEVRASVEAEGVVTANRIPLALLKGGIVGKVAVVEGDEVKCGDTLVVLENKEEINRAALRGVEVEIARINLDRVKNIDYRRMQERLNQAVALENFAANQQARSDSLFMQGSITRSELEETSRELDVRRSQRVVAEADLAEIVSIEMQLRETQLRKAQILLQEALIDLSRTTLKAPSEGKVIQIFHGKGEFVAAGEAIVLFQTADTMLSIELRIPQQKAPEIRKGQKAQISLHVNPRQPFEAFVKNIVEGRACGSAQDAWVVLLSAPLKNAVFRAGQTVSASIFTDTVICAPVIGKRFCSSLADGKYVYVKKDDIAKKRMVQLEQFDDEFYYVQSGVSEGDTVIAAKGLSDGAVVRLGRKVDWKVNTSCLRR